MASRALLISMESAANPLHALGGSAMTMERLGNFLTNSAGFADVRPVESPKHDEVLSAVTAIVADTKADEPLVIAVSAHGQRPQTRNKSEDEFFPWDYSPFQSNAVRLSELERIWNRLPLDSRIYYISDVCRPLFVDKWDHRMKRNWKIRHLFQNDPDPESLKLVVPESNESQRFAALYGCQPDQSSRYAGTDFIGVFTDALINASQTRPPLRVAVTGAFRLMWPFYRDAQIPQLVGPNELLSRSIFT